MRLCMRWAGCFAFLFFPRCDRALSTTVAQANKYFRATMVSVDREEWEEAEATLWEAVEAYNAAKQSKDSVINSEQFLPMSAASFGPARSRRTGEPGQD